MSDLVKSVLALRLRELLVHSLVALAVVTSASSLAAAETAVSVKPQRGGIIFATVLPNGYSEVSWNVNGVYCRAISNIDFSLLPPWWNFETEDGFYTFAIIADKLTSEAIFHYRQIGLADASGWPRRWPVRELPSRTGAALYITGWDRPANPTLDAQEELWTAMEAIHSYYDSHRPQIFAAWSERERLRPIWERQQREWEEALRRMPAEVRLISIEEVAAEEVR
jgi:hypothetical protein